MLVHACLFVFQAPTLQQIGLYFCAFHNYASEPHRHVLAHHFCSHVSAEMHQCIIYDSNQPNARLMGIESDDREEERARESLRDCTEPGCQLSRSLLCCPALLACA